MSGIVKRFVKRFDAGNSTKLAAIDYLTTGGFIGDQIEGLSALTDEDIIEQSENFSRALIPHFNTAKDNENRKLLKRYIENYEIYKEVKAIYDTRIKNGDKNGDKENEEDEDSLCVPMANLKYTVDKMNQVLVDDGKIILSLTFTRLDPKTIVLDKPYILSTRDQAASLDSLRKAVDTS